MRILIATDACRPQINGVAQTYERLAEAMAARGKHVSFLTPYSFKTVPCPTYPSIRLAIPHSARCAEFIEAVQPDAIHIATEGPVGWMVRAYCRSHGRQFTTSFHTRFPEYVASRCFIPVSWTHALMRRFHNAGAGVMAATETLACDLRERGYRNVMPWTRGVDTELFRPRPVRRFGGDKVFLYVGRVAIEKNIKAFLTLSLPGRKVVAGDGPALGRLKQQFPDVLFVGIQTGEALAECYASADVFVFPSRTDTFGIVLLEAMASGLPVAAFPVMGPIDVVRQGVSGCLDADLGKAACAALALDRDAARRHALTFSWDNARAMFEANIETALMPAMPAARGCTSRNGVHSINNVSRSGVTQ